MFVQANWGDKCGLRFHNDNIVFYKNGKVENRASCHLVFAVYIIGDIFVTTRLINQAQQHGISLYFLKNNFDRYASINAQADGNYLLRMKQYALSDDDELRIAKSIVANKINNQLSLLPKDAQGNVTARLEKVAAATNAQELLGLEGNATKTFFKVYFRDIGWLRRMPRAKPDIPNLLMDIGYTYLFNLADALLRLYGFDTYKGIYHKLFFQRRSLACDIIEPFRCVIDKQILKSFNLRQVNESDFRVINGQFAIDFKKGQKYNRILSEAIMEHKEDLFSYTHGFYRHLMDDTNPFPHFKL